MIAQHQSASVEHPTPGDIVEAARTVLGEIDLDPCSSKAAQKTVRAKKWIGLPKDGLAADWRGRTFVNPPGGRAPDAHRKEWRSASSAVCWWRKLLVEYDALRIPDAVFIGFNLDILQASQGHPGFPSVLEFPICVPAKRLHFKGDAPTHGNVIVYLGKNKKRFEKVFSEFGAVKL